jgi:hypothetical protein
MYARHALAGPARPSPDFRCDATRGRAFVGHCTRACEPFKYRCASALLRCEVFACVRVCVRFGTRGGGRGGGGGTASEGGDGRIQCFQLGSDESGRLGLRLRTRAAASADGRAANGHRLRQSPVMGRSPGADVAGVSPSPGADVAGASRSPGADVEGASPVPVQRHAAVVHVWVVAIQPSASDALGVRACVWRACRRIPHRHQH